MRIDEWLDHRSLIASRISWMDLLRITYNCWESATKPTMLRTVPVGDRGPPYGTA